MNTWFPRIADGQRAQANSADLQRVGDCSSVFGDARCSPVTRAGPALPGWLATAPAAKLPERMLSTEDHTH